MSSQDISMRELLEAGAHFGHQSRRWNPKMKPFIYQSRDNIHVIDLALTASGLREACEYIHDLAAEGGTVLFVATKRQAKELVKKAAMDCGMPFIVERWVGGMLTNWDTIQKNIDRLRLTKAQQASGELEHYTKKEQSLMMKEADRLQKIYEGLLDINKIPDAVFIVDVRKEKIGLKEAKRRAIPVIGVCDTNCDPSEVDIVIPANDDALKSIEYIVTKVSDAAQAGKKAAGAKASDKDKAEAIEGLKDEKPKRKTAKKSEETK